MADEKIVTSIVANSDFSGLIADVQRVTNSLHKLQQEFAGSNRALAGQIDAANAMFNQTMLKTGQFSSHFVSLTSDVEKFGRNLDSGRLKLRDYFRVYQDHVRTSGGLIRDLAQQQVQLQNAVLQPLGKNAQGLMQYNVHIPRGLDLTKNKSAILRQELQIMNKVIQDGGVQLINWGKNTQWAGRQLTVGLTLPLVAFGKAAADAFKVADQELTRLTKVYGDVAGTSAQELGKVRKEVAQTAKELSAAMGVNFAETIGLAADIAATGKTGNELLSSISETTRLSVLGEVDRQEAMKATLAIQSAFKQNTEELAESINFLNAVENQTSTTLNDLVEAIPKAGPVIRGLGGSVEDLALYLTAMREGGINASEGANALKSALASLINPTDVAVKKFQGFGIDLLGIVQKNAGSTTDTLFALQGALDKLDPLSKQQAIEQLFGKFQYSRLNALFENLGRQGSQTLQVLDLMKASASELESVANRELAAVTESAAGRYKRAVESLKASLAGVGDDFLNIATKLINVLNKIVEFGQKLPDPIKKIMAFGGAFTAIIGPVIMLTGVLANFFGYIIKGLGHFKALFKGAEGFKLLTPEIIAARDASSLLSDEFYSDAKAAETLRLAIRKLSEDLVGLQLNATKATTVTAGLGQVLTTSAGTPLLPIGGLGGARMAIPEHPLIGGYSRAAAHLNPRDPNDPSTIFGLTLQPIPLNRRIGRTPQVLMSEQLPNIEGVTSVGGISTGVVASEHARYAALMATLGVQSREEIEMLKKTIGLGGQVSREFIDTFDDILPITQRLTANAAAQSTAIVADLRAGKITAQQALAAIVAANAELERMMGVEVTAYAASRGRTIDLTKAPLIDQPVVDVSGKPNTRGMYRTGIFADVMAAVGKATKTKTYGGPYSIETTRRLNKGGNVKGYSGGGNVFYNNGDQVPGPNVNADVVPAMLTPGEFVIRRDIAQQDPDGMRALNEGRAVVVPTFNTGGEIPGYNIGNVVTKLLSRKPTLSAGSISGNPREMFDLFGITRRGKFSESGSFIGPRGGEIVSISAKPATAVYGASLARMPINPDTGKPHTLQSLNGAMARRGLKGEELDAYLATLGYMAQGGPLVGTTTQFLNAINIDPKLRAQILSEIDEEFYKVMASIKRTGGVLTDSNNPYHNISNGVLNKYFAEGSLEKYYWDQFKVQTSGINPLYISDLKRGAGHSSSAGARSILLTTPDGKIIRIGRVKGASKDEMAFHAANKDWEEKHGFNMGGMVPGYAGGGGVSRATLLARLGARFKYTGKSYEGHDALQVYRFNAMDVNGGRKYFGHIEGLSDKARGALYSSTLEFFNTSMIKGDKIGGKRMFMPRSFLTAMPTIAANALTWNRDIMTPEDILILEGIKGRGSTLGGSVGSSMALSKVYKDVFRANRGGMVPEYAGGGPAQYGYARGVQNRLLGGSILRMLAMMGLPMAGQAVGNRVGGATGSAISTAAYMGSMFMFPGMIGRPRPTPQQRLGIQPPLFSGPVPTLEEALAGAPLMPMTGTLQPALPLRKQSVFRSGGMMDNISGGKLSGWFDKNTAASNGWRTSLAKLGTALTRTNLIVGTVAVGVGIGWNKWKQYQEALDRTRLSAGLTEESAGKLGLKFKSFSSSLGASAASLKSFLATNKAIYEGMMKADAPFKMTITEYKKLRKEVKGTMQDQINLVNETKDSDLPQLAVQLKAMFVSAGMSADEASKKVYMLFTLSKKAEQAYAATLGNKAFNDINDSASAATAAVSNFVTVMSKTQDGKAQLNALNTAWQGLTNSIQTATNAAAKNAAKNKTAFDEESEYRKQENIALDKAAAQLENLAAQGQKVSLGTKLLKQLSDANPLILEFANQFDTVVSLMQKQRLMDLGFAGDLSQVTDPKEVAQMYDAANAIAARVEEKNRTGALKGAYDEVESLKKQKATLENAVKGESAKQQINRRKRIEYLQEEIKKINEAADARKKALQEEAEDQDINIEIQKKRLDYQQKLAMGDMGGAAQAQLDLQQLVNRQQRVLTERAIESRREADVAPLQAQIDKLNEASKKIADNAALAADSLESINKKLETQIGKIDAANKSLTAYLLNQSYGVGGTGPLAAGVKSSYQQIPGTDQYVKVTLLPKRQPLVQIVDAQGNPITTEGIKTPPPATASLPKLGIGVLQNKFITPQGLDAALFAAKIPLSQGKKVGFRFVASDGKVYEITNLFGDKVKDRADGSPVELPEGAMPAHVVKPGFAIGGYIRGFSGGTTDGPVSGPGTWTSDSILARLSDGEFVTKSSSVADAGLDNMHLINQKGSAGILEAAFNIINRKDGGIASYKDGGDVMAYKVIPGLTSVAPAIAKSLLNAFTSLFPKRNKAADGILPTLAHYRGSPNSSHNYGGGIDITHDPRAGVDGNKLFYSLRKDDRIRYLIWNRRIWNRDIDQALSYGRPYTGSNPHTRHIHVDIYKSALDSKKGWFGLDPGPIQKQVPHEAGMQAAGSKETSAQIFGRLYGTKYIVGRNDNLSNIAKKYKTTVSKILNANPFLDQDERYKGGSNIFKGTELNIPKFANGGYISGYNRGGMPTGGRNPLLRYKDKATSWIMSLLRSYADQPENPFKQPTIPHIGGIMGAGIDPFSLKMYHEGGPVTSLNQVPLAFDFNNPFSKKKPKVTSQSTGQRKIPVATINSESIKGIQDYYTRLGIYVNTGDELGGGYLRGDKSGIQARLKESDPVRQVQDYTHALIALANTYYGRKYKNLFSSLGISNTHTTNLDVVGLKASTDVAGNPGVAQYSEPISSFADAIFGADGKKPRGIYINPYAILASADDYAPGMSSLELFDKVPPTKPNEDGSFTLTNPDYFFSPQANIESLSPKEYQSWIAKNLFNTPRGKMSLIAVAYHEFAHTFMGKIQYGIARKLKEMRDRTSELATSDLLDKIITPWEDSMGIVSNHEYMADDFAGAMFDELSSKGFITGISKDYIEYMRRFARKNKNEDPDGFSSYGHPFDWNYRLKTIAENLLPQDTDTTTSILARMLNIPDINSLAGKQLITEDLKEDEKSATNLIRDIISGKKKGSSFYTRIEDVSYEGEKVSYAEYTDKFGKDAASILGSQKPSIFSSIFNWLESRKNNTPFGTREGVIRKASGGLIKGYKDGGSVDPSVKSNTFRAGYDPIEDYFKKLGDLQINFQTDKSVIPPDQVAELKSIAEKVMATKVKTLMVNGYADKRNTNSYNLSLSSRRAKAAADLLKSFAPGINFIPKAYGEVPSEGTPEELSKRRKVTVTLPGPEGPKQECPPGYIWSPYYNACISITTETEISQFCADGYIWDEASQRCIKIVPIPRTPGSPKTPGPTPSPGTPGGPKEPKVPSGLPKGQPEPANRALVWEEKNASIPFVKTRSLRQAYDLIRSGRIKTKLATPVYNQNPYDKPYELFYWGDPGKIYAYDPNSGAIYGYLKGTLPAPNDVGGKQTADGVVREILELPKSKEDKGLWSWNRDIIIGQDIQVQKGGGIYPGTTKKSDLDRQEFYSVFNTPIGYRSWEQFRDGQIPFNEIYPVPLPPSFPIPKFAGGGYVNPAYFSNMSMPSYFTGAKYVYNDTIAQLHKGEMVVPSAQNPNNPFAMDTAGGPININNNLTIHAAPGMDTDDLVNQVFTKVEKATSLALAKAGRSRAV